MLYYIVAGVCYYIIVTLLLLTVYYRNEVCEKREKWTKRKLISIGTLVLVFVSSTTMA